MVVRQRNNEEKVLEIVVDTVRCTHSEKAEQHWDQEELQGDIPLGL